MEVEIEVSREELEKIRKNRREIEKRLMDVQGLERTLRALKLRILLERKEKLLKKLDETRRSYEELMDFERKVQTDRELMIRAREELHEENEKLRKVLGEGHENNRTGQGKVEKSQFSHSR